MVDSQIINDQEDWDFTSESDEGEFLTFADKRGRFLVEPNSQLGSPTTISCADGCLEIPDSNAEIRKGRFSVNPSSQGSSVTPAVTCAADTLNSSSIDIEEDGKKSRFEVVPPLPPMTSKGVDPERGYNSESQSVAELNHLGNNEPETRSRHFNGMIYPEQSQMKWNHPASVHHEVCPSFDNNAMSNTWYSQLAYLDQLIHHNELSHKLLVELRSKLLLFPLHRFYDRPNSTYSQNSPLCPSFSSAPEKINSPSQSTYTESVHSDHSVRPESIVKNLESQLEQLRLENEHLKKRFY